MTDDPAICIPTLASLDIPASRAFYEGQLGFAATYEETGYLIVKRDAMELHFRLTDNPAIPAAGTVYIRGGQVPALHAEYDGRAVPGLSAFTVQPWNMKEFHLRDPHGNLLRFGCAPEEIQAEEI